MSAEYDQQMNTSEPWAAFYRDAEQPTAVDRKTDDIIADLATRNWPRLIGLAPSERYVAEERYQTLWSQAYMTRIAVEHGLAVQFSHSQDWQNQFAVAKERAKADLGHEIDFQLAVVGSMARVLVARERGAKVSEDAVAYNWAFQTVRSAGLRIMIFCHAIFSCLGPKISPRILRTMRHIKTLHSSITWPIPMQSTCSSLRVHRRISSRLYGELRIRKIPR